MSVRNNERWEVVGPDAHFNMPVCIVARYYDEQGRRGTEFICEMNTINNDISYARAKEIVNMMNEKYFSTSTSK